MIWQLHCLCIVLMPRAGNVAARKSLLSGIRPRSWMLPSRGPAAWEQLVSIYVVAA